MAPSAPALASGALLLVSLAVALVSLKRILATPKPRLDAAPRPDDRLVARRVYNEQMTAIGESVRVTPTDIVVKMAGAFALVPRSHVQEYGPDIICDDGIDWADATRRGEAWRKEHEDALEFDEKGTLIPDR